MLHPDLHLELAKARAADLLDGAGRSAPGRREPGIGRRAPGVGRVVVGGLLMRLGARLAAGASMGGCRPVA